MKLVRVKVESLVAFPSMAWACVSRSRIGFASLNGRLLLSHGVDWGSVGVRSCQICTTLGSLFFTLAANTSVVLSLELSRLEAEHEDENEGVLTPGEWFV
jgi:hypothetical protein